MSWLEKIGLVERNEEDVPVAEVMDVMPEVTVTAEAEIKSTTNIVEEIYSQNDLNDRSNSIYTVQALIDTLPKEMTTAKMQSTVSGILAVSGKNISNLVADATHRKNVLIAVAQNIETNKTSEIEMAKADIETLKSAIEAATIKIKEAEDIVSATKESVNEEVKVIDGLVEFCNGMESK